MLLIASNQEALAHFQGAPTTNGENAAHAVLKLKAAEACGSSSSNRADLLSSTAEIPQTIRAKAVGNLIANNQVAHLPRKLLKVKTQNPMPWKQSTFQLKQPKLLSNLTSPVRKNQT